MTSVLAREENFRSGDEGGEGICSSAGGLELCEQRAQRERGLRSDRRGGGGLERASNVITFATANTLENVEGFQLLNKTLPKLVRVSKGSINIE